MKITLSTDLKRRKRRGRGSGRRRKGKRSRMEVNVITSFGRTCLPGTAGGGASAEENHPRLFSLDHITAPHKHFSGNSHISARKIPELLGPSSALSRNHQQALPPASNTRLMEAPLTGSFHSLCDLWNCLSCFEPESFSSFPPSPRAVIEQITR